MGLLALYVTVLILTTQRRDDQLASYREQLTLELAILGEQKSAKIISLLEELRRDILISKIEWITKRPYWQRRPTRRQF